MLDLTSYESLELLVSPSLSFADLSVSCFLGVVDVFLTSVLKNLDVKRLLEWTDLPAESGLEGTFNSLLAKLVELVLALRIENFISFPDALVYFLIVFAA
jgi:hypothetical protein